MSVEQREEMMLQMMPEMMKKVNPKIMMPNMLETFGKMITLYNVYILISKGIKDEELKEGLSDKLKGMKDKMPDMMPMMMPLMMSMMKNFMSKMMPMMMTMMPEMMKSRMGKDGEMMCSSPEMKEKMSECMQNMCPHCVENIYPAIPKEKRYDFALKMIQTISKQGTSDLPENEKEDFQKRAFDEVVEGIYQTN
jgi:hypothetical protein